MSSGAQSEEFQRRDDKGPGLCQGAFLFSGAAFQHVQFYINTLWCPAHSYSGYFLKVRIFVLLEFSYVFNTMKQEPPKKPCISQTLPRLRS